MALESPFEMLELGDGGVVSFRVERFEEGSVLIRPAHAPGGKVIAAIRVFVPPADKPVFPHYWDLTSARLVAQIRPHLHRADLRGLRFRILARGFGPKKVFELTVQPA